MMIIRSYQSKIFINNIFELKIINKYFVFLFAVDLDERGNGGTILGNVDVVGILDCYHNKMFKQILKFVKSYNFEHNLLI